MLQQQQKKAEQDQINSLQLQAGQDTAALMARYGTRLALTNVPQPPAAPATGAV